GALRADDLVADRFEDLDDEHADHVFVVDREDAAHRVASAASGSRTVKRAPTPGSDDAISVPPCDSAIPRLTESPRPVPPTSRLVVKNGSKMRERSAASMPGPSSATVTSALAPRRETSTCTVPPSGIAWRAFAIRLRT